MQKCAVAAFSMPRMIKGSRCFQSCFDSFVSKLIVFLVNVTIVRETAWLALSSPYPSCFLDAGIGLRERSFFAEGVSDNSKVLSQ